MKYPRQPHHGPPSIRCSALGILLLAVLALPVAADEAVALAEVFAELGLEQALERARDEDKVVVIDYYADWCVPCKEMDKTTWVDPEVVAWLDEHAVALRLDADVELVQAVEHGVINLPTVLVLRGDGSVIDRLTGYKNAEELLDEIEEGLTGKDSVERARERVEAEPDDLSLRLRYADALREAGRSEEALEQYLRCWDAPLEEHREFQEMRSTFLVDRIVALAEEYPGALEALEARRKMTELALLGGDAESMDEESASNLVLGYQSLNQALDENGRRALELFDSVVARGESLATTRELLLQDLASELLRARRYDTLLAARPPEDVFAEEIRDMTRHLGELDQGSIQGALRDHALEVIRGFVVRRGLDSFEILLGAGELERALALAEQVVAFEESATTWRALAERARRVGDETTALELEARAP